MSVRTEFIYAATFNKVYDGDGAYDVTVHIDLGFNMHQDIPRKIRLLGVDTPEMTKTQREAGTIVRDFVRKLILNKRLIIHTTYEKGKFGRLLAEVYVTYKGREHVKLSEILLDLGYAKPYWGGKKKPWTQEELNQIIIKDKQ